MLYYNKHSYCECITIKQKGVYAMKTKRKNIVGRYGLQSKLLRKLAKHYGVVNASGETVSPISQTVLSFILHGKRPPTPAQAVMLEREFTEMGYAISKFDMVFAFNPGHSILELDRTQQED